MYPLSADKLSFAEIAKYWAREIPASIDELLANLEAAWWRGEIIGISQTSRLKCLAAVYEKWNQQELADIVFVTPHNPGRPVKTELEHGYVNYDFSPRISVPTKIEDWTEDSCASAFSALAETPLTKVEAEAEARSDGPPQFRSVLYPIHSIELTSEEFFRWVAMRRFDVPRFWKRIEATVADRSDIRNCRGESSKADRGKIPLVMKWLAEIFPDSQVPKPIYAPRKLMLLDIIAAVPGLANELHGDTLRAAIKRHDAKFSL
jgi:hypothetical protein